MDFHLYDDGDEFCKPYKTSTGRPCCVEVNKSLFDNVYRVRCWKKAKFYIYADKDTGFNLTKKQAQILAKRIIKTGKWY